MAEETYEAFDVLMNTAGPLVAVTAGVIGLGLLDKARREPNSSFATSWADSGTFLSFEHD